MSHRVALSQKVWLEGAAPSAPPAENSTAGERQRRARQNQNSPLIPKVMNTPVF
jgi:hypothetical protein